MKILHLNTYDVTGGAARAAYRLHKGLLKAGVRSEMMVKFKKSLDHTVKCTGRPKINNLLEPLSLIDLLPLILYPRWKRVPWGVGWLKNDLSRLVEKARPDLVHLHWICRGYVHPAALPRFKAPIVWTLHDMWPFTGGCHYAQDCGRYVESCGSCPQLSSTKKDDLTHWVWKQKRANWADVELTPVAPSRWLSECAQASSLFRNRKVQVIPNGLDTDVFQPMEGDLPPKFGLGSEGKRIILAGAVKGLADKRKGVEFLRAALRKVSSSGWSQRAELVVFGADQSADQADMGLETRYVGRVDNDADLARLYSAADVFVCPSVQENLANTVVEAMACGTPCVAFDIGGMPDMIVHRRTGYLARPLDVDDLANGIAWVLSDDERRADLSVGARKRAVEEFAVEKIALRYAELYEDLTKKRK